MGEEIININVIPTLICTVHLCQSSSKGQPTCTITVYLCESLSKGQHTCTMSGLSVLHVVKICFL